MTKGQEDFQQPEEWDNKNRGAGDVGPEKEVREAEELEAGDIQCVPLLVQQT